MRLILRLRYVIFCVFIVLFVLFAVFIPKVNINYDASKYLDDDMPSKQAMLILEQEFGMNGYLELMVEDITIEQALAIYDGLLQIEEILLVEFYPYDEAYYTNQSALFKVLFVEGNYDPTTHEGINNIRLTLDEYTIYMKGESLASSEFSRVLEGEILKILAFLIPIVIIILIITTTSWFEPVMFILVVMTSIVINMGSNIMFPQISYMTHATSGILQLAICMDYSVILLHRYRKLKDTIPDTKEAITKAMHQSFLPILGSSLTTIAGFVAIMFMQYTIGLDVGLVLTKGTIISIMTSFLLMPCLILIFEPLLQKTKHRKLIRKDHGTHQFLVKTRYVIPIIALLLVGGSVYLNTQNTFVYGESTFVEESKALKTDYKKINTTFGINNQMVILVPKGDLISESSLIQDIYTLALQQEVTIKSLSSVTLFYNPLDKTTFNQYLQGYGLSVAEIAQMETIFDTMQLVYSKDTFSLIEIKTFVETSDLITPEARLALLPFTMQIDQAINGLLSENYHRIILVTDLESESLKTFTFVESINEATADWFDTYHLIGESITINDMKTAGSVDRLRITLLTIGLVFLIIALSFRSLAIPLILIVSIQGAIWINMAIPALLQTNLMYLGYIIVSCIMLGATIDYAILYANRYLENRKTQIPIEAMKLAFEETKTTVLTSGLILIFAGYTLAFVSSIPSIAVFGDLIGRGGIASTLMVLIVLPPTMVVFDKFIMKTTKRK